MLKTYVAARMRLEEMKDRFKGDENGAALIEYSILIGLITAGAVATVALVGTWVSGKWTSLQGILALH